MNGKLVGAFILAASLLFAAGIYVAQVYAYYTEVPASSDAARISLVSVVSGHPEEIAISEFQGIDADSSPLRFRACFRVENSLAMLTETYELAEGAVPLNGPGWFSCYNAAETGAALERGEALAFVSDPQIRPGFRRVVAVYDDGRAVAWHEVAPSAAP